MLDLAKLAATPIPIQVGGKEYRLAPLTLAQLGELEQWAREAIYGDLPARLRLVDKAKLAPEEARRLREQTVAALDKASRDPLEIARMMDSCAGQRRAFALALRACQEVDDKTIDSICTVSGLMQIREWVAKTYQTGEEAKAGNPPAGPATSPSA